MEKILLYHSEYMKMKADLDKFACIEVKMIDGTYWINRLGSDIWFGDCGYDEDLQNGN